MVFAKNIDEHILGIFILFIVFFIPNIVYLIKRRSLFS